MYMYNHQGWGMNHFIKRKKGRDGVTIFVTQPSNIRSINQYTELKKDKRKRLSGTILTLTCGSGVTKLQGTSPLGAKGKVMQQAINQQLALLWPYGNILVPVGFIQLYPVSGMKLLLGRHLPLKIRPGTGTTINVSGGACPYPVLTCKIEFNSQENEDQTTPCI